MARRHPWERLKREHVFTTVPDTVAYPLPGDCDRIIEGAIWNRSQTRPIVGPITSQRWQMLQAQAITATWQAIYISGGSMRFTPTPTAADTIGYEYVTKYWCAGAGATDPDRARWVDDADVTFLDEELMTLGLVWRFQRAKGFDYSEAFRSYETAVNERMGEDGGQTILDLSSEPGTGVFAPFIEDGNWPVT